MQGERRKPGRKDNQGFIGFKRISRILQSIHCQSNAEANIIGFGMFVGVYKIRGVR